VDLMVRNQWLSASQPPLRPSMNLTVVNLGIDAMGCFYLTSSVLIARVTSD